MDALSSSWPRYQSAVATSTAVRARATSEPVDVPRRSVPANSAPRSSENATLYRLGPRAHNQTLAMMVYEENLAADGANARRVDTFA